MSRHIRLGALLAGVLLAAVVASCQRERPPSLDDFFGAFTDEWVRSNPNQAVQSRYFTGAEQDALEVQMTPPILERQVDVYIRSVAGSN